MKSFNLANFPTQETVLMIGDFLAHLISANDHLVSPSTGHNSDSSTCTSYTPFHARRLPNISIHLYLNRILKYCPCNNECFIAILVYFDRITKFYSQVYPHKQLFAINAFNVHRLVIVGIMIASKFFSDVYYTNVRYAKVGGLSVKELNNLELEFLFLIQYQVNIGVPELQAYANQLLNYSNHNKLIFSPGRYEKLPKLLNSILPVSTTSVTDVHALRTDIAPKSVDDSPKWNLSSESVLKESKQSAKSPASFTTCDSLARSTLSRLPLDSNMKSKSTTEWRHEFEKDWSHNRLSSQRISNRDTFGHTSSVY